MATGVSGVPKFPEIPSLQQFGGVTKELPDGTRIRGDIHMLMMGDPGLAKSQLQFLQGQNMLR